MADILEFKRPSKTALKKQRKRSGDVLCKSGHHKWQVVKDSVFDVKEGKLLTLERCQYCGKEKRRLS